MIPFKECLDAVKEYNVLLTFVILLNLNIPNNQFSRFPVTCTDYFQREKQCLEYTFLIHI